MKTISHTKGGQTIPIRAIAIGAGISLIMTIILSVIGAMLISNESLPQDSIGLIATITQIVSAFAGCFAAVLLAGKMPAVVAGICSGVYILILLSCNILFMNGEFGRVGGGIICIIIGGALAIVSVMWGQNMKKSRKHRKR